MEPPWNGLKYLAVELMEFSFVSVPAMPEATVIARSYRGRGKSADLTSIDNMADRVACVLGSLAAAKQEAANAAVSHNETREHIDRFGGLLLEGLTHAKALAHAGLMGPDHPFGSADETGEPEGAVDDDADVELTARVARRKSKLDALDGAEVGRVAPRRPAEVRELGGAFLAFELRRGEQALIDRIYGAK